MSLKPPMAQKKPPKESTNTETGTGSGTTGIMEETKKLGAISRISAATNKPNSNPRDPPKSMLRKNNHLTGSANLLNNMGKATTISAAVPLGKSAGLTQCIKKPPISKLVTSTSSPKQNGSSSHQPSPPAQDDLNAALRKKYFVSDDEEGRVDAYDLPIDFDLILSDPNNQDVVTGTAKHFFHKDPSVRCNSAPTLPLGMAETGQTQSMNSKNKASTPLSNALLNGGRCSPFCQGRHFCLTEIPIPLEITPIKSVTGDNSAASSLNHYNHSRTKAPVPNICSMHEAFESLLKIQQLASASGICSLEDYTNVSKVEALILKIFSCPKLHPNNLK